MSARRSSCCGGLRTGGWRGFGEGAPWPVGGLRGMEGVSLLSSVVPIASWRQSSHSEQPGHSLAGGKSLTWPW